MFHLRLHIFDYSNLFPLLLILALFPHNAAATTDYARQTGFECRQCHIDSIGGGPLTEIGRNYLADLKSKGL